MQQHTENPQFYQSGKFLLLLLSGWLLLNLAQAGFTELIADECYYWMYANHLDWGYYDHPPMVALFIRLGMWFPGEIGPRLASIVGQFAALYMVWSIARSLPDVAQKPLLFFGLAFGIFLLHPFGFVCTPDSPLLFFAALFLWSYHRYLRNENLLNIFVLALSCAGLLYSKYHGILLIGFTVLSHPSLLRKGSFYGVALLTILFFSPHIYWQVEHDWVSFRYHLMERNRPFKWWYVSEFLINIALVFNPLFWYFMFKVFRKPAWKDPFLRGLVVVCWGFLGFFLLSSLRGHVQPQWLALISFPFLLLLFQRFSNDGKNARRLTRIGLYGIPLVLFLRLAVVFPILPVDLEFHTNRSFASAIEKHSGSDPVVFADGYQAASRYAYYAGQPRTPNISLLGSRRSQYDLWMFEADLKGQKVHWYQGRSMGAELAADTFGGKILYHKSIDSFLAVQHVEVVALQAPGVISIGDTLEMEVSWHNPYPHPLDLGRDEAVGLWAFLVARDGGSGRVRLRMVDELPALKPGASFSEKRQFVLQGNAKPGTYELVLALRYLRLPPLNAANGVHITLQE